MGSNWEGLLVLVGLLAVAWWLRNGRAAPPLARGPEVRRPGAPVVYPSSPPAAEADSETWPYQRRDGLLTAGERAFYAVLVEAVAPDSVVFAKVRLADLVRLPAGTPQWQLHFNRVQAKHIDFVVCDRAVLRPVLAIELDDASHAAADRQARDATKDAVLGAAGLPLLRVRARAGYSVEEMRAQMAQALGPAPDAARVGGVGGA